DLAHDGRGGEGAELVLQPRIETLDRVDQPEEAHLLDVFERLAAVGEAAGDVVDEIGVQLHQPVAHRRIAVGGVLAEKPANLFPLAVGGRLGNGPHPGRSRSPAPRRPGTPTGLRTRAAPRARGHEMRYFVRRTRRPPVRSSTR